MRRTLFTLLGALQLMSAAAAAQAPGEKVSSRDATDVLTVTGCVQRESAYRAEIGEGKGGVVGTGVGKGDDFVLRRVRTVSTETLKPLTRDSRNSDEAYRLSGKLESELGRAVGHQVAISGYVKVKETNGTEKVPDLPQMVVVGWHNIAETCSASNPKK